MHLCRRLFKCRSVPGEAAHLFAAGRMRCEAARQRTKYTPQLTAPSFLGPLTLQPCVDETEGEGIDPRCTAAEPVCRVVSDPTNNTCQVTSQEGFDPDCCLLLDNTRGANHLICLGTHHQPLSLQRVCTGAANECNPDPALSGCACISPKACINGRCRVSMRTAPVRSVHALSHCPKACSTT